MENERMDGGHLVFLSDFLRPLEKRTGIRRKQKCCRSFCTGKIRTRWTCGR
jgi:hypothetical protein